MRYLTVQNFGTSLGVEGARLVVREHDGTVIEESLSRLRGIRIAKKGVSISSNLILECAARGIRIFFH
ncbi:MAG: CRISPR-associated endonuclease Cas1 [Proteobacteria bacterium]|nr:CRISPR-associated endonuclease Cas1 [Pseudomonadota bacterium]